MTWILFSVPFVIVSLLVAIGPVVFGLYQQRADEHAEALGLAALPEADRPPMHRMAA